MSWFLRCASHHDCFVLPFWLPRHKIIYRNQNRMALLFPGSAVGRLHYQQTCAHAGLAREAGRTQPQKIHASYLFRCRQVWHSFRRCWLYIKCVYVHFFFLKAHLVNTDCYITVKKKSVTILGPSPLTPAQKSKARVRKHADSGRVACHWNKSCLPSHILHIFLKYRKWSILFSFIVLGAK